MRLWVEIMEVAALEEEQNKKDEREDFSRKDRCFGGAGEFYAAQGKGLS